MENASNVAHLETVGYGELKVWKYHWDKDILSVTITLVLFCSC